MLSSCVVISLRSLYFFNGSNDLLNSRTSLRSLYFQWLVGLCAVSALSSSPCCLVFSRKPCPHNSFLTFKTIPYKMPVYWPSSSWGLQIVGVKISKKCSFGITSKLVLIINTFGFSGIYLCLNFGIKLLRPEMYRIWTCSRQYDANSSGLAVFFKRISLPKNFTTRTSDLGKPAFTMTQRSNSPVWNNWQIPGEQWVL